MGSNCSSRQSGKDSASIKSEDSQNDQNESYEKAQNQKEEKIASSGGEKTKMREKAPLRFVESDFSSCGDEGAGVGTPMSSTVSAACASDGLAKGKPPEKDVKGGEELPDLSILKEETRQLLEGKSLQKRPRTGSKIVVVLLGRLEEFGNGTGTKELLNTLNKELLSKFNSKGMEILLINPHEDLSLYNIPYSTSDLVAEYIKEQSGFSSVFIFLLRGSNPELHELSTVFTEEDFTHIVEGLTDQEDQDLLEKWYVEDTYKENSRKLKPARMAFTGLSSEKTEDFNKAYQNWRLEYKKIMDVLTKASKVETTNFRMTTSIEKNLQFIKELPVEIPFKVILIRKDAKRTPVEDKIDQFLQTIEQDGNIRELAKDIFSENRTGFDILRPKLSSEEGSEAWWKEISSLTSSSVLDCIESSFAFPKTKTPNPMEEGINSKLHKELCCHYNFCWTNLCEKNSYLDSYLNKVQKYVTSSIRRPLLIVGSAGSGKSVLVSSVSNHCQEWVPNTCVMTRFVGLTNNSTTLEGVLHYLVEHSIATHGHSCYYGCSDMESILKNLWSRASSSRPIIVLIDGIDQLTSEKSSIFGFLELISELPDNVKVVITANVDSFVHKEFEHNIKSEEDSILKLENLTNEASEVMLTNFMIGNNQNLSKTVWENIKKKHQSPIPPLYFYILSQLLLAGTKEQENCSSNLENEIEYYFNTLQSIFSKTVLQSILGCLAITRIGLLEHEIISILISTGNYSSLDWLYLRRFLKPLIKLRSESDFFLISLISSVRDSVVKFFVDTEEKANRCFSIFRKNVFTIEESRIFNISLKEHEKQSLQHLRSLQDSLLILEWKVKEMKLLFNLNWLYKMIESSGPFKVLEELEFVLSKSSQETELSILREVLQLSAFSLVYDSSQFFSQIYGRFKWRNLDENCPRLSALLARASESPLPCLLPLSPCLSGVRQDKSSESKEEKPVHINAIFRIPGNPHHVIAVSTSRSRVTVWNIIDMEIVRTLNGINQPRKLEMIDDYRCLLLCGRELRIFNLNEGTFLMKLREVMNQKMPFFGLRDADHVVSLSRNRMYVNMMNLTEGNCVTTFKVGEDRFLNSLLVSENGKICVCGDDTQKPSALLVWDLELRKLMYDLRIPHHEFATRLAAITIEGHYVCCVCKEVNEPAPNFIVVYDLQSGTLFKRWKPDFNTISITISTAGTCVIVGLEDSSVMAFDLITGNRRWTVYGHTSPPDTFRLDQQGLVLLSYDSQSKDQSLRVWDVHTGTSLATLTADQKISSCEITCDGKAVVLAFEGQDSIYTFLLLHKEDQTKITENVVPYGDNEYKGKVADFSQT